jgi:hypothetical protein
MKIEVDRKYWENEAYKDFYDHTTKIATDNGKTRITKKTHPDYFARLEELQHMKRPETPQEIESLLKKGYTHDQITGFQKQGLSSDQIKHRAWAEAHNQLFTDRLHMEASADNADQAIDRVIQTAEGRKVERGQKPLPGVMDAKDGKAALLDPEGYSRMWQEKSRFYQDIIPAEAIAQSQKGIAQYMKIRDGYRIQKIEPPPLNPRTAKAMEVIVKAQVGVKATEGQLAVVKGQLKDLGFKDINDAMKHIASENEILKWSKPGAATVPVRDLNATDLARISRPDLTTAGELEEQLARLASGEKIL